MQNGFFVAGFGSRPNLKKSLTPKNALFQKNTQNIFGFNLDRKKAASKNIF